MTPWSSEKNEEEAERRRAGHLHSAHWFPAFTKLSKGKPKSEVPYAMRQSIEKRIGKMKGKVARIQKKLLPDIRKKSKDRVGNKANK